MLIDLEWLSIWVTIRDARKKVDLVSVSYQPVYYVTDPAADTTIGCSDLGAALRKSNSALEADRQKSSEASIIHSFIKDE
jgi:hypothetical protein